MTLERSIAYVADDELVEVTPKAIRLRKRFLDANDRKRQARQKEVALTEACRTMAGLQPVRDQRQRGP